MSMDLEDDEFEVEVTFSAGRANFGPNTHPAVLVSWVVSLFVRPGRVIPCESGQTITAQEVLDRYLLPGAVVGVSAAEVSAHLRERWGGR